ncbi:MAG TPA: prolipoprotein diacylglyceryl transferase [Myxococcales bacterium]|nr:prolipoprotein diacylglyceryl transferase [Myxococcales bacterium]
MMPILYKFEPGTSSAWLMYLLWVAVVGYAAWSGWRGAAGPFNQKKGEYDPPRREDRLQRAGIFGGLIAILGAIGLQYALPAAAFPGGKGEGVPIHLYGILLAGGFMGAVGLAAGLARREWRGDEGERRREQILDLAFWVFLAGMVGSRVLFIFVNWKDFSFSAAVSHPLEHLLGGGLVFQGGLAGATLASYWYCRKEKLDFLRLADIAVPTISLGACLGRLGCFSAGCCWGDVAGPGAPFAVHFPGAALAKNLFGQLSHTASLAFQSQATTHRWVNEATGQLFDQPAQGAVLMSQWVAQHSFTFPVHPTQLYESLGQFILFVTFLALRPWRRFHGQLFGAWLMAYGVVRGGVELFRGDAERGTLHGLIDSIPLDAWYNVSTGQGGAIALFALGAVVLWRARRAAASPAAAAVTAEAAG